jgi:hypothetical protein
VNENNAKLTPAIVINKPSVSAPCASGSMAANSKAALPAVEARIALLSLGQDAAGN